MEIILKCEECGRVLEGEFDGGTIYVDLCPRCKRELEEEAYEKGHDDGYEDSQKDYEDEKKESGIAS